MSWFPVDDAFHGHPKARKAGFEAIGLWTVSGSYCMAYLTDGFVPEWFIKEKPRGAALAKRLVAAELWIAGINAEGETGFWFHDWKKECTKEHVLDVREKARQRKAKSRESHQESQGESHRDGTCDATRESLANPTQPNPTHKKNSGSEPSNQDLGRSPNRSRGSRLPADWMPASDVVAQMRSDHPQIDLKAEHAKFSDHWHDQPGVKGRKVDWTGTWRNWIRRAAEQQPARAAPHMNGGNNGHDAKVNGYLAFANQPQRQELEQ